MCSPSSLRRRRTPAEKSVVSDVVALGEDGDDDERVQVQPFHEDPHSAGRQHVVEDGEQQLALPVLGKREFVCFIA